MDDDRKVYIKDLTVKTRKGYLCVRVLRKWIYDGNKPGGPILYIGLVLADEEGKAIYAQIPESEVERKGSQLSLDRVYTIRRFNVRTSKMNYMPFDAELMLEITSFTTITPSNISMNAFPTLIYNITPLNEIKTTGQACSKYIDVIGIVTSVDLPKTACPRGKEHVSILKEVVIKDLSDNEVTVTLWGDHVQRFQLHGKSPEEPAESVVALFCGCLPKRMFNKTHVNAANACCWFLNPNIKEAQPFYDRLKDHPVKVYQPIPATPSAEPAVKARVLQLKTIAEMNALNPYDFPEEGCKCTTTVTQIPENQEWWYMGCVECKKRVRNEDGKYYCKSCRCSSAIPMYKLSLIAADGTAEAKFFCHDVVARQIIRRNCDSLIKTIGNTPGLPPQMLATIGKTYTFAVGLTDESYRSMQSRTYLIDSVIFRPQQQQLTAPTPLALEPAPQLAIQAEEGKFGTQTNVETVAATNKDANILTPSYKSDVETTQNKHDILDLKAPEMNKQSTCQTPPPGFGSKDTPPKEIPPQFSATDKQTNLRVQHVRKRLYDDITSENQDNKIKQDATYTEVEKKSDKQMPTTTEKIGQKMEKTIASKSADDTEVAPKKLPKTT
ncbi:hypothetical protein BDA96_06G164600 [Sorghum bicolor]|uniref:Replication factor A C-terminal domain-containing protein n=1 Tax=Sorghum bicolor TaxID=4558 RepID=A0A921QQS5_SORBI|nr:hypothetical protein BDA96_06G164600 [Sorghum bicolor]